MKNLKYIMLSLVIFLFMSGFTATAGHIIKIEIELDCEKEFSNISSAIGKKDCSNNFVWRRDGSKYILETRFVEIGNFLFTIYLDYSPAITYRVTVEK